MVFNKLKEKINNVPVCDQTRIFDCRDYELAIECFLDHISTYNTIKSIYQIGSISAPGLSDIDLLIVMRNNCRDIIYRYSITALPENVQYIFSHDGWLMDERTFKNLPYWFPYFDLKHIYGVPLEPDETHKNDPNVKCILLTNYLITKVPSNFVLYSCLKGLFYERIMVNMVNSLRHSISLWADIYPQGYRAEYRSFSDEYQKFRKEWFDLSEHVRLNRLSEYVVAAILLGYRLIEDMNTYLCDYWFNEISLPSEMSFKIGNNRLIFKKSFSSEEALSNVLDSGNQLIMYYPIGFGCFLHQYTYSRGIVGRHISSCLNGNDELIYDLPVAVRDMFNRHIDTIEHYAWFHGKKFGTPVNGYHTYWAPHTMSGARWVVDKIINRVLRLITLF